MTTVVMAASHKQPKRLLLGKLLMADWFVWVTEECLFELHGFCLESLGVPAVTCLADLAEPEEAFLACSGIFHVTESTNS